MIPYYLTVQRMEKTGNGTGWVLYQRDDCHLCDLALEMLADMRFPEFESVFIDGDDALEERYGTTVPVLLNETSGQTMAWPFNAEVLRNFLEVHAG